MLNTVKDIIGTVGDSTGSLAKSIGHSSADLAKTIGTRTVTLANDIGPKRALIGAAILVAAVGGGIVLVRYLRRREQARLARESKHASFAAEVRSRIPSAEPRAATAATAFDQ